MGAACCISNVWYASARTEGGWMRSSSRWENIQTHMCSIVRYVRKYWFRALILLFLTAFITICTGLGAAGLSLWLHSVQRLMFGLSERATMPAFYHLPWWKYLLVPSGIMLVASIIWCWLWSRSMPYRVVDIRHALNGSRMPVVSTLLHVLLQITLVGSGVSIGREVAPRELAALCAQHATGALHCLRSTQRVLISCAAGSGLAAVYHAPIAGAFMAAALVAQPQFVRSERLETARKLVYRIIALIGSERLYTFFIALIMGQFASLIVQCLLGESSYYALPKLANVPYMSWCLLLIAMPIGVVCGLMGFVFRMLTMCARRASERTPWMMLMMPFVGVLTGAVALWRPEIMGNGRALAQYAYNVASVTLEGRYSVGGMNFTLVATLVLPLILLMLIKIVLTTITLRAGASGGVLQPSIASGVVVGVSIVIVMLQFSHVGSFLSDQPQIVLLGGIMGASAMLTASRRSLWMAVMLVAQLVQVPLLMLPPMFLASAIASLTGLLIHRCVRSCSHDSLEILKRE